MVNLIVGKKNFGKTTRLRALFTETPEAAGFCSEKVHDCGRVKAYQLEDLKTKETRLLAKLLSLPIPEKWGQEIQHGPFRFSTESFSWAAELLEKARKDGAKAFFIDELGKMELEGNGHSELIRKALDSGMDLFITVRDSNVDDAVKTFGIEDYKEIPARD